MSANISTGLAAWTGDWSDYVSALWLLALPATYLILYCHVADVVRAIPNSNEDFHL